jgi:chemotaxis protein CheD
MDAWAGRKIHVNGGDCVVADNDRRTLSTVLGSCIAACLYDPVRGVGGMNHYLLPKNPGPVANTRYGEDSFPRLLQKLDLRGAAPCRLVAKIFGGARMLPGEVDIGLANIEFAEMFLRQNNIPIVDTDVGGHAARWIDFHPTTGRVSIRRTMGRLAAMAAEAGG